MRRLLVLLLILGAVGVAGIWGGHQNLGPVVVTSEGEQKIIFRLGEVRRVTQPGATLRLPFIETVETFESRWLYLKAEALPIQTKDGELLQVDNYVIWRIGDAVQFKQSFPAGMATAYDRIDRIVRDDVREVIGLHTLTEVLKDEREAIMTEIAAKTRDKVAEYGISVADVRINRTELPPGTEESVYARIKTERERLARKNRAEGEERGRRIRAVAQRDAQVIVANAKRDSEITRGQGDAKATRIYAEAFSVDPSFYDFVRSLEAYRNTIGAETTLVLSPKSEFFRFFQSIDAEPSGR